MRKSIGVAEDKFTVVAALIIERPLCTDCIASKVGVTLTELVAVIERMHLAVAVNHTVDCCRACGRSTTVLSLTRPSG